MKLFDRVSEFFLGAAIVVIPVFLLPSFSYSLDRGRQFLFFILILCSVFFFLWGSFARKEFKTVKHPAFVGGVVSVVFAIFSAIMGGHWYGSGVGLNGEAPMSLMSLCAFFLFFYLISVGAHTPFFVERIIFYIVCSGYVMVFFIALILFKIPFITYFFGDEVFHLLVGSADQFSLFLLVVINASLVIFFHADQFVIPALGKNILRVLLGVVSLTSALLLILFGKTILIGLWLASAFFIIVYVIVYASRYKTAWLIYPMFLFALVGLSLMIEVPWRFPATELVRPPFQFSADVLVSAVHNHPFFGFGPASYAEVYSAFAPSSANATALWNAQFFTGYSDVVTMVSDRGILGFAVWLIIQLSVIVIMVRFIRKSKKGSVAFGVYLFASWSALFVAHFFLVISFTVEMLWWLHTGLLVGITMHREREKNIERHVLPVVLMVGVVAVVVSAVIGVRFAAADYWYAKALAAGPFSDASIVYLNRARGYAHNDDRILRALTQTLLIHFKNETAAVPPSTRLAVLAKSALEVSAEAVKVNENDVRNLLAHADAYMTVAPYAAGAPAKAVEILTKAIKKAPNNPLLFYALGTAQRALYEDLIKNGADKKGRDPQNALVSAEGALRESVLLRPQYAEGYRALGQVYLLKEENKKAINVFEKNRQLNPQDAEGALELALAYVTDNQRKKAADVLDEILYDTPDYANALWYRALLYAEENNRSKAREYLQKILKNNPANEAVKLQIERLQ